MTERAHERRQSRTRRDGLLASPCYVALHEKIVGEGDTKWRKSHDTHVCVSYESRARSVARKSRREIRDS